MLKSRVHPWLEPMQEQSSVGACMSGNHSMFLSHVNVSVLLFLSVLKSIRMFLVEGGKKVKSSFAVIKCPHEEDDHTSWFSYFCPRVKYDQCIVSLSEASHWMINWMVTVSVKTV